MRFAINVAAAQRGAASTQLEAAEPRATSSRSEPHVQPYAMVRQPLAGAEADGHRCDSGRRLAGMSRRSCWWPSTRRTTRARLVSDIATIADVAALNSTAAITFGDAKAAAETLSALRAESPRRHRGDSAADGRMSRAIRPRSRSIRRPSGFTTARDAAEPSRGSVLARLSLDAHRPIVLGGEVDRHHLRRSPTLQELRAAWLAVPANPGSSRSSAPSAWRSCCRAGCSASSRRRCCG